MVTAFGLHGHGGFLIVRRLNYCTKPEDVYTKTYLVIPIADFSNSLTKILLALA